MVVSLPKYKLQFSIFNIQIDISLKLTTPTQKKRVRDPKTLYYMDVSYKLALKPKLTKSEFK